MNLEDSPQIPKVTCSDKASSLYDNFMIRKGREPTICTFSFPISTEINYAEMINSSNLVLEDSPKRILKELYSQSKKCNKNITLYLDLEEMLEWMNSLSNISLQDLCKMSERYSEELTLKLKIEIAVEQLMDLFNLNLAIDTPVGLSIQKYAKDRGMSQLELERELPQISKDVWNKLMNESRSTSLIVTDSYSICILRGAMKRFQVQYKDFMKYRNLLYTDKEGYEAGQR